jgi:regulator of sigma E protease
MSAGEIISVILQLIASLSMLVIVHEFGHFIFAKIFKVRVEKFYLFFNPGFTLFKFKPKNSDTEYGVGWLPLGGYVKLAGMIDESMDREQLSKPPQPWEFRSKPAWQRLIIMTAGVIFNFLLAILLYAMILLHWGDRYVPLQDVTLGMEYSETAKKAGFQDGDILLSADGVLLDRFGEESVRRIVEAKEVNVLRNNDTVTILMPDNFMNMLLQEKQGFANYRFPFVVKNVLENSPAAAAGLVSGDSVIAVNDTTAFFMDCLIAFDRNRETPINLTIVRQGNRENRIVTPNHEGKIGVEFKRLNEFYGLKEVSYNFVEAIPAGIRKGVAKLTGYVSDMKYVFTKEGAQSLGGFGTIAKLFPAPFHAESFWEITAFLSVILAFMNILPIPALDGGHVLFLLYEVITRRKPSDRFMETAQMIGMILLIALVLYANMNDLFR